MIVTRIVIRYKDKPQISLLCKFNTDNMGLIKRVVKEYYGAHHVFLNFEEG